MQVTIFERPENILKKLNSHKRENIQVLTSHTKYDFAKAIFPDKNITSITLLRDPVQRVKSQINYIYSTPTHFLHKELKNVSTKIKDWINCSQKFQILEIYNA